MSAYDNMAIGIFELDSYLACFVALDAAAKAANVRIQGVERNRLKQGACVKMRGYISDVNAAMDAALSKAREMGADIYAHTIIAQPLPDVEPGIEMTINK